MLTPVLYFVTLAVSSLLLLAITSLLHLRSLAEGEGWASVAVQLVLGSIIIAVAAGVVWLLMRYVDRAPFRRAGLVWTRRSLWLLLLGVAFSAVITWLAIGSGLLFHQLRDVPRPASTHTVSGQWAWVASGVVAGFVAQGIPEELLFRGYLLQSLGARPVRAVLLSATVFGIMHLASNSGQDGLVDRILYLAGPFGFALLAGALALRLRSLWVAIGVHGGSHLAVTPAEITGIGVDTRYYWVVTGVLYVMAGVLVLRHHGRDRVVLDR